MQENYIVVGELQVEDLSTLMFHLTHRKILKIVLTMEKLLEEKFLVEYWAKRVKAAAYHRASMPGRLLRQQVLAE